MRLFPSVLLQWTQSATDRAGGLGPLDTGVQQRIAPKVLQKHTPPPKEMDGEGYRSSLP